MDDRTKRDELEGLLDELDHDILRAIERRARAAQELSKLRTGTARFAPSADGAHLAKLEKAVSSPLPAGAVRTIFAVIDSASRMHDVAPRVAFIGSEGGFGWLAATAYFGVGADLVRADATSAALQEVARSGADFAVIPYESLEDGPIFPTIQEIGAADLKLVGERELTQTLVLMNVSGNPADVEKIYAAGHHHAVCVDYLESNHPRALIQDVRSPTMAWELASEAPSAAAIVPKGFAASQHLVVARENIGDAGAVRMRYGVVSRLPAPRSGSDATALLFSVRNAPGALHDILQHFKEKNCNLRRIQSRPMAGEGWEYLFYVEVSGHVTDRPLVAALEGVKKQAKTLKIIGSFPLENPEPVVPSERPL